MTILIQEKIAEIEKKYNVKILYAVESGSRAWGFASKDSDYDVRFIYMHEKNYYLGLEKKRDVIEYILNDELDITGWDLSKALALLYASNPTLLEWLNSPIIYYEAECIQELRKIMNLNINEKAIIYHYISMAKNTFNVYIKDQKEVKLKKYFYIIRPILAAYYTLNYHFAPPVLFDDLKEITLPNYLKETVDKLTIQKKNSIETEYIERIPLLDEYYEKSIQELDKYAKSIQDNKCSMKILNEYFIKVLNDYAN